MTKIKFFPENFSEWSHNNSDQIGIIILRSVLAMVWFSQGMVKVIRRDADMYKDHNEFLSELNYMRVTHPYLIVEKFIEKVLISNVDIVVNFVILTEISIGISLGLGIFTRAGAIAGGLMTISLFILTLGWDQWIWTYPLIFFPHLLFFLSRSGRQIGLDRAFIGSENKIIDLIS
ncbi:MAG: DoxX family membrane protein [Candidatus Heimdallarchaeota archaeon]|nr:DoxX family membrane protein [Candidatus Heimdallarchaeota archaeon]